MTDDLALDIQNATGSYKMQVKMQPICKHVIFGHGSSKLCHRSWIVDCRQDLSCTAHGYQYLSDVRYCINRWYSFLFNVFSIVAKTAGQSWRAHWTRSRDAWIQMVIWQ